jgi:hypothetical protein
MHTVKLTEDFHTYYTGDVNFLLDNEIFVFGSNLAGIHGAGAARLAEKVFNAKWGCGMGFTGQCYAIATKDLNIETLKLAIIEQQVQLFKQLAFQCRQHEFIVTKIGCGLAGYTDAEIAPMFKNSTTNCIFHKDWKVYLE